MPGRWGWRWDSVLKIDGRSSRGPGVSSWHSYESSQLSEISFSSRGNFSCPGKYVLYTDTHRNQSFKLEKELSTIVGVITKGSGMFDQ